MAKTGGKGVDVVLNSLSGPLLKASWEFMARFGRLVDITKVDMEAGRRMHRGRYKRSPTYMGFDLMQLTKYGGRLTQEALAKSLRICHERGKAAVYPVTPYSISDMAKAMHQMQGGTYIGKLVLVPRDGDQVHISHYCTRR